MENQEMNVLPTEDLNVETLPVEATKSNTTRNVMIGLGVVTLIGGLTFLGVKLVKKLKAKKATAEEPVEAATNEEN